MQFFPASHTKLLEEMLIFLPRILHLTKQVTIFVKNPTQL